MGWAALILEIIKDIAKAIPYLDRWFTKTPGEKEQESKDDVRKDIDDFKDGGRPK